jgi:hypothetical protein
MRKGPLARFSIALQIAHDVRGLGPSCARSFLHIVHASLSNQPFSSSSGVSLNVAKVCSESARVAFQAQSLRHRRRKRGCLGENDSAVEQRSATQFNSSRSGAIQQQQKRLRQRLQQQLSFSAQRQRLQRHSAELSKRAPLNNVFNNRAFVFSVFSGAIQQPQKRIRQRLQQQLSSSAAPHDSSSVFSGIQQSFGSVFSDASRQRQRVRSQSF